MTRNLTIEEQTFQATEEARSFYVNMEIANMSLGVTDSSGSHCSTFSTKRNPLQNNSSQPEMTKLIFLRALFLLRPCLFAVTFLPCASAQTPLCIRLA